MHQRGSSHHAFPTHVATLRRGRRTVLAATGLVAALALTATACDGSADSASDKPDATTSQAADAGGKVKIPADLADKLKEHDRHRPVEGRRLEELGQGQVAQ
jgi:hypothetical protein